MLKYNSFDSFIIFFQFCFFFFFYNLKQYLPELCVAPTKVDNYVLQYFSSIVPSKKCF